MMVHEYSFHFVACMDNEAYSRFVQSAQFDEYRYKKKKWETAYERLNKDGNTDKGLIITVERPHSWGVELFRIMDNAFPEWLHHDSAFLCQISNLRVRIWINGVLFLKINVIE